MSDVREDLVEQLLEARDRWRRGELSVVDIAKLEVELHPTVRELGEVKRREIATLLGRPALRVVRDADGA